MLYASGYTLEPGFKVRKTGALIADSEPKEAEVIIEGYTRKNIISRLLGEDGTNAKTPAKIKNLAPGRYDITLHKEGYYDWKKNLEIKPGESTYIEDVSLFKKGEKILLNSGNYAFGVVSPDKKLAAFAGKSELAIFSIDEDDSLQILFSTSSNSSDLSEISWSPNSKSLISGKLLFFEKDWNNPLDLKKLIGDSISRISWETENGAFYYVNQDFLWKYDVDSKRSKEIIALKNIKNYSVDDNLLFYLENLKNASNLNVRNLKTDKVERSLSLPSSEYVFWAKGASEYVNVFDSAHKILYLADPFSSYRPIYESIANVDFAEWVDNEKLLYASLHEIWIFNSKSRSKTLLTRISDEINSIAWHPGNNYALYATDKEIFTIELDDREKYNITRIISAENIGAMEIDKQGDAIYFISATNGQKGAYKYFIR